VMMVEESDEVILISSSGKLIRTQVSGISVIGRNTQGVKLFEVQDGETVAALARVVEVDTEAGEGEESDQ